MASNQPTLSSDAQAILELLRDRNNVLIAGPPAIGKSRLLSEVRRGFQWTPAAVYEPHEDIPLPSTSTASLQALWLPSPDRTNRKVFSTVFDQSTKMRDVLRGLVPRVSSTGQGLQFRVSEGTLYRAAEHALTNDGAALLMVDEINRGPAVAAFGPSLVALEADKRLDVHGQRTADTQTFELLNDHGEIIDYALPKHLYLVAAMNQADTSVEPLDVAFLRRFAPFQMRIDLSIPREHFSLPDPIPDLPDKAVHSADVYAAAVAAWAVVNQRLALGRGNEFQIGHGVLMLGNPPPGLVESCEYVRQAWQLIRQHLDEVFFGDVRGIGEVLSAGMDGNPYTLDESIFAGQPVVQLLGPHQPSNDEIYSLLRCIATQ